MSPSGNASDHLPEDGPEAREDRPVNKPPIERPLEPPPEEWIRVWLPVTLLLVGALFFTVRAVLGTGEAWAECQLQYVESETGMDSSRVDALRLGSDELTTCGALRIGR